GLLREVADPDAGEGARVAEEIVVHPRHDPEQRGLARAVRPDHADLGAGVEGEVDALEDLAGRGHDLPQVPHREDVFAGHRGRNLTGSAARRLGGSAARRLGLRPLTFDLRPPYDSSTPAR